ncbi:MAG: tetraacyldisaccharide 4'-kinase [Burkholderiales bacterium]|nr:tetraacyldisaccharide 4'-kinase [Burkholderiales bacterium]
MRAARPAQPGPRQSFGGRIERWLARLWWRDAPGVAARLLWPLSCLYGGLSALHRWFAGAPVPTPVPVIVVGNLVVGGAGKTPIVIALVQALQAAGWRPGVIARGHGREEPAAHEAGEAGARAVRARAAHPARAAHRAAVARVTPDSTAREVGDEPLLVHRRTGVPVFVGRKRADVAAALCAAHPSVDVIVSDDGLQHHALARAAEVVVFDDRGAGNGLLLPAGPLRQPLPAVLPGGMQVVYSGRRASTALTGTFVPRTARQAVPLQAWRAGTSTGSLPLGSLRGRRLSALAGIGAPEQFFSMLEAAGLEIERLPSRDHADYVRAPWPDGTAEVVTTEKDAVKLAALPDLRATVWVVPLDCELPAALLHDLLAQLPPAKGRPQEPHR